MDGYERIEDQEEVKKQPIQDHIPIEILSFLAIATFSLVIGILIRWDLEANWYWLNSGKGYPTLSDLIRLNEDGVMQPLYIVFYSFFTLTAFMFLYVSHTDDTHPLDTNNGAKSSCVSLQVLDSIYHVATIFYWVCTAYGIFTLIMLFLFDNKITKDDHLLYASWGFVSLLIRSWCLWIRRRTRRTTICYVPCKSKECIHSFGALLFFVLNTIQVVACTVCVGYFPNSDNARFEFGIVFCLAFDPLFQVIDFVEDRTCEHAIREREKTKSSVTSVIKIIKAE